MENYTNFQNCLKSSKIIVFDPEKIPENRKDLSHGEKMLTKTTLGCQNSHFHRKFHFFKSIETAEKSFKNNFKMVSGGF